MTLYFLRNEARPEFFSWLVQYIVVCRRRTELICISSECLFGLIA
ncbi:hypothetical protein FB008_115133 [Sinorhizobium medicae]|nr:hypothetical protein FB008_115133 [Sinorhizobium medicae]